LQRGEGLLRGQTDGANGTSGANGAGGLLQRELGQGLNRLFGPTQPTLPQQPPATAPR
jgi:hypothetical protein